MAQYKEVVRDRDLFVMGSLDSLLSATSIVRTLWAALEPLDFSAFDAQYNNDEVGRRAIDCRSLVGVWILALLRGDTSSVRLASLCERDIEYRWLLGGSCVEKSCLCDFRKKHADAVAHLGAQVLTVLGAAKLLPGEHVGVDGTVVRAAASRHAVKTRKGLLQQAQRVEALLQDKLSSDETPDEGVLESLEQRRAYVQETLTSMQALGLVNEEDRLTTTEPAARLLRQKDGSFSPGYNIQGVVDLDSGALIHAEVIEGGSDSGQLQPQVEQAAAVLKQVSGAEEHAIQTVAADAGYHDARQLAALEGQGVACFVPDDRNANRVPPDIAPAYRGQAFVYDKDSGTCRCPEGQILKPVGLNENHSSMKYRAKTEDCASCPAKAQCCPKNKVGRSINLPLYPEVLENVAQRVQSEEGVRQRRARAVTCEGAFARINGLLHWRRCRMWGKAGVQAELLWRQFTHNVMLLTKIWKPMIAEPIAT